MAENDITTMSQEELTHALTTTREELHQLRFRLASGQERKMHHAAALRGRIARILTRLRVLRASSSV